MINVLKRYYFESALRTLMDMYQLFSMESYDSQLASFTILAWVPQASKPTTL